jgi:catechol 2,3-dioxygenase-like lactoylglutathione lyase family enzyme
VSDTATSISGTSQRVVGIDHVQLAMPPGGEPEARRFYAGALGLTEVPKPAALAARGGCWFETSSSSSATAVKIHLGVESDFRPARKAHPALVVNDLDALLRAITEAWPVEAIWSDEIPGTRRCHIDDPFGNRIELIAAESTPETHS